MLRATSNSLGNYAVLVNVDRTGANSSSAVIQSAINTAYAAGGGIVYLPSGTIKSLTPLTPRAGVAVEGVGWSADAQYNFTGGTRLIGDGTNPCFAYNNVALSGQFGSAALALAAKISGVRIRGICFDTFTRACDFGGLYNTGCFDSEFEDLLAINCTQWGFFFENSSLNRFKDMRVSLMASGSTGAIWFCGSSTAYNHGNNYIENVIAEPNRSHIRGIVIQANSGAAYNDINGIGIQCNQTGTKITTAATMSGGSANITLADATNFDVDKPVTVSVNANGFVLYQTYFVKTKVGNVVTLANRQGSAAINSSGASAVNLDTYGWPCLEVSGIEGSTIQPSTLLGLDMEGIATSNILVQNAYVSLGISYIGGSQGTINANALCLRLALGGTITSAYPLSIDCDFASGTSPLCAFGLQIRNDTKPIVQVIPPGFYQYAPDSAWILHMGGRNSTSNKTFQLQYPSGSGEDFVYPFKPMGQHVATSNTTSLTLNLLQMGAVVYTGTSSTTWTLPLLINTAGGGTTAANAGIVFEICNGSTTAAVDLTIAANSGNYFNRNTGLTSITIPQYGSLTVRANFDGTTAFWQIVALEASGTYTPTLTSVANLDSTTAFACQWNRVGQTITVSGKLSADPTAPASSTQIGISLPPGQASNFTAAEQCCGTAAASGIAGQVAAILADAANDRAQMQWVSGDVTNQPMYFQFTYQIL